MRPLIEEETKTFIEKISKYIGRNVSYLIDRPDQPHCFVLQKDKVYYVREDLLKKSENVARDQLCSVGVCFGKFTKTKKFKLHVTALDYLAQYAKYKIWIKSSAEMSYLYGNHVLKAHVAKMTEDVPEHQGVIVYSMSDIPLGFAVTAKSAVACTNMEPNGILAYHQTDIGEYLREEDSLF